MNATATAEHRIGNDSVLQFHSQSPATWLETFDQTRIPSGQSNLLRIAFRPVASPAIDAIALRYNFGTTEREKKRYAVP
jgi:hypothetical protein